jgi:hypothetical protein
MDIDSLWFISGRVFIEVWTVEIFIPSDKFVIRPTQVSSHPTNFQLVQFPGVHFLTAKDIKVNSFFMSVKLHTFTTIK